MVFINIVSKAYHLFSTVEKNIILIFIIYLFGFSISAENLFEEIIFEDNFSEYTAQGWELEEGWRISGDSMNFTLYGKGHNWARFTQFIGPDFRIKFRLKMKKGAIHLNCRMGNKGRYFIGFEESGSRLGKQYWPDTFMENLAGNRISHRNGVWHTIEITGQGDTLQFIVNGKTEWTYKDRNPLKGGNFALEMLEESEGYFDDLVIYGKAPAVKSSWIRTGGPPGGLGYDIRMRSDDPNVMYVTDAWAGVFKSTNGGAQWYPSNNGIQARAGASGDAIPVFSLTIDPHNNDIIWIGTQDVRGIYKTLNGGDSWTRMDNGVIETNGITFRGFTVDPRSSDIVFASAELSSWVWAGEERRGREFDMTAGVVYKTVDGGKNWNAVWRGENLARYVWIDPDEPETVYISTGIFDREASNSVPLKREGGGEGIIKSTDGGKNWFPVNYGLDNLFVGTLFMHPVNPKILIAGTGHVQYHENSGVYITTNGGSSWKRTLEDDVITSVEFSGSNPAVVYAGSSGAIYRSENGGMTWKVISGNNRLGWGSHGVRAGFPIDFQVDPEDSNKIYVNNYGGGNFLSTDGGKTWSTASTGYTGAQVRDIAIDPQNPSRIYAAARSGIFVSEDSGNSWRGLNFMPANSLEWNVVCIDIKTPDHILAANNWNASLLVSSTGGQTWRNVVNVPGPMTGFRSIAFAPGNTNIVYAGTSGYYSAGTFSSDKPGGGIYVSRDNGASWKQANDNSSENANVAALVVDLRNPETVYAGTTNSGILKTQNRGGKWIKKNHGLPPSPVVLSIAQNPDEPDLFFAGLERGGIFISTNSGDLWKPSASGLNPEASITDIVFDPASPNVLYISDLHSGVYRSVDGGNMWEALNKGLYSRAVNALSISRDGKRLYAAIEGEGVYRLDID
jgi:photosystem II stability/assembly factor-like uncharacterized protein